jgi:hypothetical protein
MEGQRVPAGTTAGIENAGPPAVCDAGTTCTTRPFRSGTWPRRKGERENLSAKDGSLTTMRSKGSGRSLSSTRTYRLLRLWTTQDVRKGRQQEQWVNAVVKKSSS